MNLKDFQNRAIAELNAAMKIEGKRDIILKSPTGSGKTIILTHFMSSYMKDHAQTAFIWLTPGQGNLEEQSKAKMDAYCHNASTKLLADVMTGGFAAGDAVFINWQKLNRDSNVALKDGERTNFLEWIQKALAEGLSFKVVIDESHYNFNETADTIVEWFKTDKIVRASATPLRDPNAILVDVPEEDVIAEGLIKNTISINPGFPMQVKLPSGVTQTEYLLGKAVSKRSELRSAFAVRKTAVNPLILVQLPNNSDALLQEVVDWFAAHGIDTEAGTLAIWLANRNENTEGLTANDGRQMAVVLKQAVATGWDCPRAHVLVKLRENMGESFEIQTIGRIRRMPEACHYGDGLLDTCYLYTFDEKFTAGVIGSLNDKDVGVQTLFLKSEHKSFELVKEQRTMVAEARDPALAQQAVAEWLDRAYGLTKKSRNNRAKLEAHGYEFSEQIRRMTISGDAMKLEEIKKQTGMNEVSVWEPISTHRHGREFHHVLGEIGAAAALPYNDVRQIVFRLFGEKSEDKVCRLQLKGRELYAFVLNNHKRLEDDFRAAMSEVLAFTTNRAKTVEKPFQFPREYLCAYDAKARNQSPSGKNVYKQYPMSAVTTATRSTGEVKFERWCEKTAEIDWVYRNGDKGDEYFSVVYEDNSGHQRLFYPDYILSINGRVWIVEVKGGFTASGGSENIDIFASKKAVALKAYCAKHSVQGGFVCYDEGQDELLLNVDGFSEDVNDPSWKTIEDAIES